MRWGLDLLLSLVGVLMGFATVSGWLAGWEGFAVGILIGLVIALVLGQYAGGKYFWNGFVVGVVSSLLSSLIAIIQFDSYFDVMVRSGKLQEAMDKMAQAGKSTDDLKSVMHTTTLIGMPIGAAIWGAVQGLLALLAGKVFGKKAVPAVVESMPADDMNNPSA
jgi:Na+/H+-translocating membrane pyrophosphatase